MATQSVSNSLPTFVYDLYRARGRGSTKRLFNADEAAASHALAEVFGLECEVELFRFSCENRGDVDYERELGERILRNEANGARFKGLRDDDWVGLVASAFYCRGGKKAMVATITLEYGNGWKAFLVSQNVARRHPARGWTHASPPPAEENARTLPMPTAPEFEFVWHWVRVELSRLVRPPEPGSQSQAPRPDVSARPAINRARVLKKKVAFVGRENPDGSFVIEGSADGGMVSAEVFLSSMREDGYRIEMMSVFEAVGLPWARAEERRIWVALVEATVAVTRDAIRRADGESLRQVLMAELPSAVAPLRPAKPL